MKQKKNKKSHKHRLSFSEWLGFLLASAVVVGATSYGLFLTITPTDLVFDSAPESLAVVGVALSNNIGTGLPRANEIPVKLPDDVADVQDSLRAGLGLTDFFHEHFSFLEEFSELVAIDVVNYLNLHPNRQEKLEFYIDQVIQKTEGAQVALTELEGLSELHKEGLSQIQKEIKDAQIAVETAYNDRDGDAVMSGLIHLEELHTIEQEHTTILLFSQKIGGEYRALIAASQTKISVLQANMTPLVEGVTVTLPPGTNIDALKNLHLFNE